MKYKGLNSHFFTHSLRNPQCNHLAYAKNNDLMPSFNDLNNDIELTFDSSGDYFDIIDAFEVISETNPMIQYFVTLKNSVIDYYHKKNQKKLKGYIKNAEISFEGLFTRIDFLKINHKEKTIDFIIVKPTVYNEDKLFVKKIAKKGGTLKSLGKLFNQRDIETLKNLESTIDIKKHSAIKALFDIDDFATTNPVSKLKYDLEYSWKILLMMVEKALLNSENKLRLTNEFKTFPYLTAFIWKKTKRKIFYQWEYIAALLLEKYPKYKITSQIEFIKYNLDDKKEVESYEFESIHYNLDPTGDGPSATNANRVLNDLEFAYNKLKSPQKWTPNPRYKVFDVIGDKCKICENPGFFIGSSLKDGIDYNDLPPKAWDNNDTEEVKDLLKYYPNKIAMFDFETITSPIPKQKYYYPWNKIVVQVSCHLLENNKVVKHEEYIVKDLSKKELTKIYEMILRWVNKSYALVAYYKAFENGAIKVMERVLNRDDISSRVSLEPDSNIIIKNFKENPWVFDLYNFFQKRAGNYKYITRKEWNGSSSIKYTIQYALDDKPNPYKSLNVNNGFYATKLLYEHFNVAKKDDETIKDLYEYCKQDTKSMVDLYLQIRKKHL